MTIDETKVKNNSLNYLNENNNYYSNNPELLSEFDTIIQKCKIKINKTLILKKLITFKINMKNII